MKHVTVPDSWNAEQALAVISFLERTIEAVWRAHGGKMLLRQLEHGSATPPPAEFLTDATKRIRPCSPDDETLF